MNLKAQKQRMKRCRLLIIYTCSITEDLKLYQGLNCQEWWHTA